MSRRCFFLLVLALGGCAVPLPPSFTPEHICDAEHGEPFGHINEMVRGRRITEVEARFGKAKDSRPDPDQPGHTIHEWGPIMVVRTVPPPPHPLRPLPQKSGPVALECTVQVFTDSDGTVDDTWISLALPSEK